MKIKIFTECGKDIGIGHISRCSALYREAINRGIFTELIVYSDTKNVEFLENMTYIEREWFDYEYLEKNISLEDYVIVDSYKATKKTYKIISKRSKKALFIDDIGRLNYPEGIILNPSLDIASVDYSLQQNIILFGPKYVILRDSFRDLKRTYLSPKIKKVIILMGGTDIRGLIPFIIEKICKNKLDVNFDIIINKDNLEEYKKYNFKNIKIYNNLNSDQIKHLMINSDFAITGAGQTIYELLATETPFIPIQLVDNQKNNIKSLLKYNPEQIFLNYDDLDLELRINQAWELYEYLEYRKKHNIKYQNLVDGRGSVRILDKLTE